MYSRGYPSGPYIFDSGRKIDAVLLGGAFLLKNTYWELFEIAEDAPIKIGAGEWCGCYSRFSVRKSQFWFYWAYWGSIPRCAQRCAEWLRFDF